MRFRAFFRPVRRRIFLKIVSGLSLCCFFLKKTRKHYICKVWSLFGASGRVAKIDKKHYICKVFLIFSIRRHPNHRPETIFKKIGLRRGLKNAQNITCVGFFAFTCCGCLGFLGYVVFQDRPPNTTYVRFRAFFLGIAGPKMVSKSRPMDLTKRSEKGPQTLHI